MGDFATEIMCLQKKSGVYAPFTFDARKLGYYDSAMSTGGSSGSDQWWSPKVLSPDDSMSGLGGPYRWCEVPVDRNLLFNGYKARDIGENGSDQEYKFYTPRRVSSLKTSRTPPGTPKNKAVRFADALGLDLEDVRHIFNLDLPPKIPASAVQDLVLDNDSDSSKSSDPPLRLVPNFSQPGAASDFLRRVKMHNVALENVSVDRNNVMSGVVRVANITFDKRVTVRTTFDEWIHSTDLQAAYVQDSHDGATDRFSFSMALPEACLTYGHRVQLAVLYECANGAQYWDNNFGQNYVYCCLSEESSVPHY